MMRVLNSLRSDEEEFITSSTIRGYSEKLYYGVENVIKYFTSQGFIIEVLNDMFYIKDINEIRKKEIKYSPYELISRAFDFKNVKNWYFGLNTALAFDSNEKNDVIFNIDTSTNYVISDRISVDEPVIINEEKFSFLVFKDDLLNFGIKDNGKFRYSNLEKTLLDFIYLYNCNHVREGKTIVAVSKYKNIVSRDILLRYSKKYPANVAEMLEKSNLI